MTKVIYNQKFPAFHRDEILTPFDRMFNQIVSSQFPKIATQIEAKTFKDTEYPKINSYDSNNKASEIETLQDL